MKCKICGNSTGNESLVVKEMMFGSRESFEYFLCAGCGALQISEFPEDMAPYYAGNYYSHQTGTGIRAYLEQVRDQYALTGRGLIGNTLSFVFPNQAMSSLRGLGLKKDARILDVGCGSGALLFGLKQCGFSSLVGADPFADPVSIEKLEIKKQPIEEIRGEFDLIMYHHSFEHLPDPLSSLSSCHGLLAEKGTCIIRIPVVPCDAWDRYGANWVQIDAPRHFFLHSLESMKMLAKQTGFAVDNVQHDSTAFQFWGSEQYKNNIPMMDERSFFVSPLKADISIMQVMKYARQASTLNASGRGDQAVFYLKKENDGQH